MKVPPLIRLGSRTKVHEDLTSVSDNSDFDMRSFENEKRVTEMRRLFAFLNDS